MQKVVISLRDGVDLDEFGHGFATVADLVEAIGHVEIVRRLPSGRMVTIVGAERDIAFLENKIGRICEFEEFQLGVVL